VEESLSNSSSKYGQELIIWHPVGDPLPKKKRKKGCVSSGGELLLRVHGLLTLVL
jgi:hypothetical protein